MIHIPQYRFIEITGVDSTRFLQGQITADAEKLQLGGFNWGAHCNVKGRVIGNFILHKVSNTHFILRTEHSNAENLLNALKKYAVFSKVSLEIKNTLGCFESEQEIVSAIGFKLNSNQYEYWLPTSENVSDTQLDNNAALLRQIEAGNLDISNELSEKLLPQEAGLDTLGGISYKKGCYTGQEVIARIHYKGKLKHTLWHISHESPTPLGQAGDKIEIAEKTPVTLVATGHKASRFHYLALGAIGLSETLSSQENLLCQPCSYAIPNDRNWDVST